MAIFRQEIMTVILAIQCSHVQGVKEGLQMCSDEYYVTLLMKTSLRL